MPASCFSCSCFLISRNKNIEGISILKPHNQDVKRRILFRKLPRNDSLHLFPTCEDAKFGGGGGDRGVKAGRSHLRIAQPALDRKTSPAPITFGRATAVPASVGTRRRRRHIGGSLCTECACTRRPKGRKRLEAQQLRSSGGW